MAVPDFQSLMRPYVAVHQDSQPHTSADLWDRLATLMQVSEEDWAILEVLIQYPTRVDMKILRQFPEYEAFRARTRQRKGQPAAGNSSGNTARRRLVSNTAFPSGAVELVYERSGHVDHRS